MPMPHARTRRGSTLGQDRLRSIHEDRMIRTLMPRTFQASRDALLCGSDTGDTLAYSTGLIGRKF
jgi:hypothetical protein